MTGKYNVRNYDVFGVLHPDKLLSPTSFGDAGYKTFIAGKWHWRADTTRRLLRVR